MNSAKPRVLIADDDDFFRKLLGIVAAMLEYEIVGEAVDGVEALAQYQALEPDMLWLDLNMPELNGDEVLKKLVAKYPAAFVIMLTGDDSMLESQSLTSHGARQCVVKGSPDTMASQISVTWQQR